MFQVRVVWRYRGFDLALITLAIVGFHEPQATRRSEIIDRLIWRLPLCL